MEKISMRAAVLATSLLIMSPIAVSPAVADMIAAFPRVNPNITVWVVTMPSIAMVIFSLVYSRLVLFIAKRTLIAIAMTCFIIGGITPAFLNDIYLILAMRFVFGAGIGFLMPLSSGLVADFYDGEMRAAMMGWQSAFVNFGGLLFMFTGGLLAAIHWNLTFFAYTIGFLVAAWVLFMLPEPKKAVQPESGPVSMPYPVFALISGIFLFNILFFALMTNASVMISSENLGDASQAGTVLTMFSVGGFFSGVMYGKTAKIFKRFTNTAGWSFTGIGMLIVGLSSYLPVIIVGTFLAGAGMAITMPSYLIKISQEAPASAISVAYAYTFVFVGVGQFISPIFFDGLIRLFDAAIGRFPILASAAILLSVALLQLLLLAYKSRADAGQGGNIYQ